MIVPAILRGWWGESLRDQRTQGCGESGRRRVTETRDLALLRPRDGVAWEDEKGPVLCPQTYFSSSKNVFSATFHPKPRHSAGFGPRCVCSAPECVGCLDGRLGVCACVCRYVPVYAFVLRVGRKMFQWVRTRVRACGTSGRQPPMTGRLWASCSLPWLSHFCITRF